jgi:hypothetical protein
MSVEQRSGLHEWQAVVVRLWSESDEAFAALTLTLLPEDSHGAPWMARLRYGAEDDEIWLQEIVIGGAQTIQQALRNLSQRAARLLESPIDVPDDLWLSAGEVALIEKVDALRRSYPAVALELGYSPELGMSSCWVAMLHDPTRQPPDGVILTRQAGELAEVCKLLIDAAEDQGSSDRKA